MTDILKSDVNTAAGLQLMMDGDDKTPAIKADRFYEILHVEYYVL